MAGLKNGSVTDTVCTLCTPDDVPLLLETPYPFQVIQTRGVFGSLREARVNGE
jgi:hypothetical protein